MMPVVAAPPSFYTHGVKNGNRLDARPVARRGMNGEYGAPPLGVGSTAHAAPDKSDGRPGILAGNPSFSPHIFRNGGNAGDYGSPGYHQKRQENIARARANGTFDPLRNGYNQGNVGSWMDQNGNIGPRDPANMEGLQPSNAATFRGATTAAPATAPSPAPAQKPTMGPGTTRPPVAMPITPEPSMGGGLVGDPNESGAHFPSKVDQANANLEAAKIEQAAMNEPDPMVAIAMRQKAEAMRAQVQVKEASGKSSSVAAFRGQVAQPVQAMQARQAGQPTQPVQQTQQSEGVAQPQTPVLAEPAPQYAVATPAAPVIAGSQADDAALQAQGIADQRAGVLERGRNSVIFRNGAAIMPTKGASGAGATLTSPYGTGSVTYAANSDPSEEHKRRIAANMPTWARSAPTTQPATPISAVERQSDHSRYLELQKRRNQILEHVGSYDPGAAVNLKLDELQRGMKSIEDKYGASKDILNAAPPEPTPMKGPGANTLEKRAAGLQEGAAIAKNLPRIMELQQRKLDAFRAKQIEDQIDLLYKNMTPENEAKLKELRKEEEKITGKYGENFTSALIYSVLLEQELNALLENSGVTPEQPQVAVQSPNAATFRGGS